MARSRFKRRWRRLSEILYIYRRRRKRKKAQAEEGEPAMFALSADDGSPLADDDDQLMETY